MKEGIGDTFMIVKQKEKWYEKMLPEFLMSDPHVIVRGIESMNIAKLAIDDFLKNGNSK